MLVKTVKRTLIALVLICCFVVFAAGCNKGGSSEGPKVPEAGEFYSLQEAYKNNWLTNGDLLQIVLYNNNYTTYPEELSEPLQDEIKEKAAEITSDDLFGTVEIKPEDMDIDKYYGTYRGFAVVTVKCKKFFYTGHEKVHEMEIGGVTFRYANNGFVQEMAAWKI